MTDYLVVEQLQKAFHKTSVLKSIDFSLARGECLVLLGPSGCGKTTLLNIIAGLYTADAGRLYCDGALLDGPVSGKPNKRFVQPMARRRFAMVFQDFSLWPHMSVADNVAFALKLQGLTPTAVRARVMDALEKVQMAGFAQRKPAALSGGQQQRVAIARAIAVQPRVLLLDEPLSALDARLRDDLKAELAQLLKETGLTSVYVTHDQSEAFCLGDKVALMNAGRIEQLDTPQTLYYRPKTRFAAQFIGHANLVPFEQTASGLRLLSADLPVSLAQFCQSTQTEALGLPTTGEIVVRREAVRMVPQGSPVPEFCIGVPAHCVQQRFLGDRLEVIATAGNNTQIRGFTDHQFAPAEPLQMQIACGDLHVLSH